MIIKVCPLYLSKVRKIQSTISPCRFRQLLLLSHIHQGFLTKMSAILFSPMHVTCSSQIKFLDTIIWIIKNSVRHWNYEVSKRICSNPLLLPSSRSKYSPQLPGLSVCYKLPCYVRLLKKYCMLQPQYNTVSCTFTYYNICCAFGHNCAIFRLHIYKFTGSSMQQIYDNWLNYFHKI